MRGDFHIHSKSSDGELSPREIVILAKGVGLDAIAIADHNTVDGIEEAVKEGKKRKIKIIPALELSTRYRGERVHVLGYFNYKVYKNKKFVKGLQLIREGKIKEFRKEYLKDDREEKHRKKLAVEEGIAFLKKFKAKVILAHPVTVRRDLLHEVLKYDFDGIEAIHSKNTKSDTEYFINIAKERGYIYTAGSDFHRMFDSKNKYSMLGFIYLDLKDIDKLFSFWKNEL